jgi:hypothetical protein
MSMGRAEFFDELAGILANREDQYGAPAKLFDQIARIWTVILSFEVEPEQVALCMVGVKLARLSHNWSHADSIRDVAGYAAILSQLVNEAHAK